MSQDYLNVRGNKEIMTVGQKYFDELVKRSFFQDVEVEDSNESITCKIHDIIHDFLQYLTKNEFLILGDGEIKEAPNDRIHHLTLLKNATLTPSSASFVSQCTKLRTLAVLHWFSHECAILELIVQLKGLRTLNLGLGHFFRLNISKKIGGLIHLRYLDLSNYVRMETLPDEIGSLYNLQTLKLIGCSSLTKINVQRLINLRYLYVENCESLILIKGIANLRDLQRLDWYIVPYGLEKGNRLEDLKNLNRLQGSLTIRVGDVSEMAEYAGILMNKPYLVQLSLCFWTFEEHQEIMNGLEPHAGLRTLSICCYGGGAFSNWLTTLHSLRVLTLTECGVCKILPPLGKLTSLESLHIEKLDGVSKVGVGFLGIQVIEQEQTSSSSSTLISFPNLKRLTIDDLSSWEEWEGVEEEYSESITIMPCLSHLKISRCPELKALPDFLWKTPLQKLNIGGSSILQNLHRQGKLKVRSGPRFLTSQAST